jgi:vitamin B12/bleomycin/antimicrobial peptide transport system ATP-binding/permease protein
MTNLLCKEFFKSHAHYRVVHTEGIDNPDQRISQDVANFVVTSTKLILKLSSTIFNTLAFGGNALMHPCAMGWF